MSDHIQGRSEDRNSVKPEQREFGSFGHVKTEPDESTADSYPTSIEHSMDMEGDNHFSSDIHIKTEPFDTRDSMQDTSTNQISCETELTLKPENNDPEFEEFDFPTTELKPEYNDPEFEESDIHSESETELKPEYNDPEFEESDIPIEMKVKSEPTDDYLVEPCSPVSAIPTDIAAGGNPGKWEDDENEMAQTEPIPVSLIPAAGRRGLLRIDVEDPLHPVQSGTMKQEPSDEDMEMDASSYGVGAMTASDDVSLLFRLLKSCGKINANRDEFYFRECIVRRELKNVKV
jgi:hypothetical protein